MVEERSPGLGFIRTCPVRDRRGSQARKKEHVPRGHRDPKGFRDSSHSKPEVGGSPSGWRGSELANFQQYPLSPSQHLSPQPFLTHIPSQAPRNHTWHTHALGSKKGPALSILGEALASSSLTQCFLSTHCALGRRGALPECRPPAPGPASPGDASSSMGTCWSELHPWATGAESI